MAHGCIDRITWGKHRKELGGRLGADLLGNFGHVRDPLAGVVGAGDSAAPLATFGIIALLLSGCQENRESASNVSAFFIPARFA